MAAALNLSRHPAAVLTSLRAPCVFADLDGVVPPYPALASSGPPGWIASASGGRIQGRPRASGTAVRAWRPGASYPRCLQRSGRSRQCRGRRGKPCDQ